MWGRVLVAVGGAALLASMTGCADEADDPDSAATASGAPAVFEDHWHAAFGVYVCDEFLPDMPEFESETGIHTHGDGVIHIHPYTSEGAGDNATLGLFLDHAGIDVSDTALTVDDETHEAGDDACGGEEAEVVVLRWGDAGAGSEPERVDASARFRQDGEAYVVAYVPEDADVPEPESAANLEALGRADSAEGDSPTTSPPNPPGEDGTPAADTDDRTLVDGFYEVEALESTPCRPGLRLDREGESCLRLPDEPAVGTDIVDEAEATAAPTVAGSDGWLIALTLTDDGIRAFNEVAARCYQQDPTCPLGQVALVVDDEVVFYPTIAEPSYERDELQVSGALTEDEARSIADALAG